MISGLPIREQRFISETWNLTDGLDPTVWTDTVAIVVDGGFLRAPNT